MSAHMTAFEVEHADRTRQKLIARQPSGSRESHLPDSAQREFKSLQQLRAAGLPVQAVFFCEDRTEDNPTPLFVLEYVEGRPVIAPTDERDFLRKYADRLVQVQRFDHTTLVESGLPTQDRGYEERRAVPNEELGETAIFDALESVPPITRSNAPVMRHGDFWPGNVLWRDNEIVAVIDWEECLVGEPLADLAICRLDLWWILGEQAAYEFTELYQAQMNLDLKDLPYWDLCASLRPITNLEAWAPAYLDLGRTDITYETMARDHRAFVSQALSKF